MTGDTRLAPVAPSHLATCVPHMLATSRHNTNKLVELFLTVQEIASWENPTVNSEVCIWNCSDGLCKYLLCFRTF